LFIGHPRPQLESGALLCSVVARQKTENREQKTQKAKQKTEISWTTTVLGFHSADKGHKLFPSPRRSSTLGASSATGCKCCEFCKFCKFRTQSACVTGRLAASLMDSRRSAASIWPCVWPPTVGSTFGSTSGWLAAQKRPKKSKKARRSLSTGRSKREWLCSALLESRKRVAGPRLQIEESALSVVCERRPPFGDLWLLERRTNRARLLACFAALLSRPDAAKSS